MRRFFFALVLLLIAMPLVGVQAQRNKNVEQELIHYFAGSGWTWAGEIHQGDLVDLYAYGRINLYPDCRQHRDELPSDVTCSDMLINPEGMVGIPANPEFNIITQGWAAGLIARINGGTPFVVGRYSEFIAADSGTLEVRTNDQDWAILDDIGRFVIRVRIEHNES